MKKTGRRKISRKSNRISCRTGIAIRHGPHRRALRRANAAFVRHPAQSAPALPAYAATPAKLYGLKCLAGRTVRHRWLFPPAAPLSAGNGNALYCSKRCRQPNDVSSGRCANAKPTSSRQSSSLSACSRNAASGIASPFHCVRISASRRKRRCSCCASRCPASLSGNNAIAV
ncbi:Uncharacterised protein [Salmonella enterica subsp. enterica]|nr:Uncharacterised protein [Salmonella enterica subsp. enterica]